MKLNDAATKLSRAHWLFLVLGIVFGLTFVFIVPPLWGLDEVAHFNRVLEISRGQLVPEKNSKGEMGSDIPKNLAELEYTVYGDLTDNHGGTLTQRHDRTHGVDYNRITSQRLSEDMQVTPITATYSPIAYAGPLVGVLIADKLDLPIQYILVLGRICGLAVYLCILFLTLWIVRDSKIKWAIFVVGIIPTTLFQASVISADTLANALGLMIFAIVFRLGLGVKDRTCSRNLLILLIVSSILIPMTKINNIFLSFMMLAVPAVYFSSKGGIYLYKIGTTLAAIFSGLLWTKLVPIAAAQSATPRIDGLAINPPAQLDYLLHYPFVFAKAMLKTIVDTSDTYLKSMTVDIGWNVSSLPYIFVILIFFGLVVALLYAKREIKINKGILQLAALLSLGGIVSVFAALYVGYNPVAYGQIDGIQGRYFTPFILPMLALIGLLPLAIKLTRKSFVFFCISVVFILVSSVGVYIVTLK